ELNPGRFIALAAMRHRRDVRRVRFREQHIERRIADHLVVIVRKGDNAGKGERKAEIEELLRGIPIAREKMYIAFHLRMRLQEPERILIRVADMEHKRFVEAVGEFYLFDERLALHVFGTLVDAVIIEAAFAYRDDARVFAEFLVRRPI